MASTKINSINLGPIWLQSGNGTPDHFAIKSTVYINLDDATEYINNDGFVSWTEQLSTYNTSGITSGITASLNLKYDKSGGTVSGNVIADTFIKSGGTSTQFLKADGSVDGTLYEDSTNKQNSMVYDGTGDKFPTVDGVNLQANNLLKVASGTGFIDYNDTFNMILTNSTTITVAGSDPGTFIKSRLFLPPFIPLDAVRNITSRIILASSISLPSDGRYFKFLGYDYATDTILASTTGFFLVNDIVALGTVEMLRSGGVNSFISLQMQLDVSTVSLFDLTMSPNQTTSKIYPNSNLTINTGSGLIKSCGISWGQPNPHIKIVPSSGTTTFIRIDPAYLTTSTGYSTSTTVDTTTYWNGSSLVSTGNNNSASIQRWLLHIDGRVFLQVGEQNFSNFSSAQAAALTVSFTDIIPTELVIEIARMAAVKNTSNLSNTTQAQFYYTLGGGSVAGGSTSFATIGGSPYDNLLLGAELNSKFNITGGTISGNTNILGGLTANTISATTYFNLPLGIRLTGGTYSSGTTTFTNNTGGTFSVSGYQTLDISTKYDKSGGTVSGSVTANTFVKSGGTSTQFLMADGSVSSGLTPNIRTITSTTTALSSDYTLLCNASTGITVNLPSASSVFGVVLNVKKINNTVNNITIDPNGSELIDDAATFVLSTYLQTVAIQSNGINWYIIN